MNNDIKLSVMVTFCHQKEFIKDALDSCINQKVNFNFELLIGLDDGDDESRKIIKEYLNKYSFINLFEIDSSKLELTNIEKASKNRLNLLKRAQGEYLTFLDGDDFFCDENRFQILIDCLDKYQGCIAAFHDQINFDNKTKKFGNFELFGRTCCHVTPNWYLSSHRQCSCFCYRNIFKNANLNDLNLDVINDSTFTYYFLRYGKFYYYPRAMLAYRIGVESIFTSKEQMLKNLYILLCAELNHNVLPIFQKRLCKKHRRILKACFNARKQLDNLNQEELKLINNFARKQNCYFTSNIINYTNLTVTEKIKFHILKYIFMELKINLTVSKKNIRETFYFMERPNFGDVLNLYILQRLFGLNIKYQGLKKADLIAIGSFLHPNLSSKPRFGYKKIKVWGTGMIKEKEYKKEHFKREIIPLALRGEITKQRVEKILNKKLNCLLGDPGLLASKLIDTKNIKKEYKVGIIAHYVDSNSEYIKNIKLSSCNIIDVTKNPIFVLNEIAKCEVILSSAMHGLIAADSLGIPNQWIKFSDDLYGGDYKFYDYYSVFNYTPKPIDLRSEIITNEAIEKIKINYQQLNCSKTIEKLQQKLIEAANKI